MEDELTLQQKILTNKFTPLVLMLLQLWFFFYVIPPDVADNYFVFFSILGGAITCALSFWLIGLWCPILYDKIPIITGLFCISTLFIFGMAFIWMTTQFSSNQLRKNGVVTLAVVVDKTQYFNHKGHTTQNMDVEFVLPDNTKHRSNILLTEHEYHNIQQGMTLPIMYSSAYPDVAAMYHP